MSRMGGRGEKLPRGPLTVGSWRSPDGYENPRPESAPFVPFLPGPALKDGPRGHGVGGGPTSPGGRRNRDRGGAGPHRTASVRNHRGQADDLTEGAYSQDRLERQRRRTVV